MNPREKALKILDETIKSLEAATFPFHVTLTHKFTTDPELPGICSHCGWVDFDTMAPCGEHTLREHAEYQLHELKEFRDALRNDEIELEVEVRLIDPKELASREPGAPIFSRN